MYLNMFKMFMCVRCSSRSFCTSSWRRSGAALRPGLLPPSRGTLGASSAGGTSSSSDKKPLSSKATSEDTRPGTEIKEDQKGQDYKVDKSCSESLWIHRRQKLKWCDSRCIDFIPDYHVCYEWAKKTRFMYVSQIFMG